MELHQFGNTKIKTTRLGLGTAALGRPGYITLGHNLDIEDDSKEGMEHHMHNMLDLAYENGIRYFDTARSYGLAELFLGNWLEELSQERLQQITIGTKWGYTYTANWASDANVHEVKEHSFPVLLRQWGETKGLLGDTINILQIHSAILDTGVLDNSTVLDGLRELRRSGITIGLTVSGHRQKEIIEKALQIQDDGELLFDSVQVTWNMLEQSATDVMQQASEAGLGIIVKEVVANGLLTIRGGEQREFLTTHGKLMGSSNSRKFTGFTFE